MGLEAATYTTSFILSHTTLYGSQVIDDAGTGLGKQYHMSDSVRKIPSTNQLYIQISANNSGYLYEDANGNGALINFIVDFWVDLGPTTTMHERNWDTHFLRPPGSGLRFKGCDQLIDPWWWQDPSLGNPSEFITGVQSLPTWTVIPEAIGNSGLRHAQLTVVLQAKVL